MKSIISNWTVRPKPEGRINRKPRAENNHKAKKCTSIVSTQYILNIYPKTPKAMHTPHYNINNKDAPGTPRHTTDTCTAQLACQPQPQLNPSQLRYISYILYCCWPSRFGLSYQFAWIRSNGGGSVRPNPVDRIIENQKTKFY